MGHTIAEKILMKATGSADLSPGDLVEVEPDYAVCHDIYTEKLYKRLDEMGFDAVKYPERLVIFHDHLNPACLPSDPRSLSYGYKLAEKYGIQDFHPTGGICHQLIPELGYAKPGRVILCTDSHTTTYGAVGCFSTGIGYTEMAYLWGTGKLWLRVPASIKIEVNGTLPAGVYSKDIILRVLGDLKAAGGTYRSLEFCGSAIEDLSIDSRLTMSNMAVECGAKAGLFPADEKTALYCKEQLADISWVRADDDATYDRVLTYRAEDLEPVVACPPYVDNIKPLRDVVGTKITQVCIGSCTNGRLEDLEIAARILKGKQISPYVKLVVTPASNAIMEEAMRRGYIQAMVRAGAMVTPPYCSFCEGRTMALMSDGEVMLGTNNRNFLGRFGSPKAQAYLASPAVAAASALTGEITAPTIRRKRTAKKNGEKVISDQ